MMYLSNIYMGNLILEVMLEVAIMVLSEACKKWFCEALIICYFILVNGRLNSVSPIQDGYFSPYIHSVILQIMICHCNLDSNFIFVIFFREICTCYQPVVVIMGPNRVCKECFRGNLVMEHQPLWRM